MDTLLKAQLEWIIALQAVPGLASAMGAFSFLGNEEFFLLLLPLVYLCINARVGARLAFILLFGNALNGFAKLAFHAPRPYWLSGEVRAFSTETSYGIPSGHAQNATSVWFFLADTVRKRWAWAAATAIVLLISLSRVYLGVHFITDVLVGWALGAAVLGAFMRLEPVIAERVRRLSLMSAAGLWLAVAVAIMAIGVGLRLAVAAAPDPTQWALFSVEARSLQGIFTSAGALFGTGAGYAAHRHYAKFSAGGAVGKRLSRFVIGLAGAVVFWLGLKAVFPTEPEWLELTLRFVRYSLATGWVILATPWLSLKFGLAEPAVD